MLRNVQSTGPKDASDFAVRRPEIVDIASAHRVNYQIEFARLEHRERRHRPFDQPNLELTLPRYLSVQFQHSWTDVYHRYVGAGSRVKSAVATSSGCQAKDLLSGDRRA
jgi:hypothetical protein